MGDGGGGALRWPISAASFQTEADGGTFGQGSLQHIWDIGVEDGPEKC